MEFSIEKLREAIGDPIKVAPIVAPVITSTVAQTVAPVIVQEGSSKVAIVAIIALVVIAFAIGQYLAGVSEYKGKNRDTLKIKKAIEPISRFLG